MMFHNLMPTVRAKHVHQPRRRRGPKRKAAARAPALRGVERCEDRLLLTFHLWQMDQVFSSADGKVQFIELHDPANRQRQPDGCRGHAGGHGRRRLQRQRGHDQRRRRRCQAR